MKSFYAFAIIVFLFSCSRERCIKAEGPRVIYTRKLAPAATINLDMVADLTIEIDSTREPQLEKIAQEILQKEINVIESEGELTLSLDVCVKELLPILLNARLPIINQINNFSAGSVNSKFLIEKDSISFYNYGLGDINFSLESKHIFGEIRSSGNLSLNGYAEKAEFLVIGSGNINAYNLQTDEVVVNSTGISLIEVYAGRILRVNFIKPGGQVKYRGNPEGIIVTGNGILIDDNI